jgi:cell division protease FtsH
VGSQNKIGIKRKFLLLKFTLEFFGLSFLSFLLFYFLSQIFSSGMERDKTSYRRRIREKDKSKWVGELPKSASDILDIFNYSDVYGHFGSHLPKGILLYGKPGTGKTHFAKIIAELTESSFFYASASQFDELFIGRGAQRVRNLFDMAYNETQMSTWDNIKSKITGKKVEKSKTAVIFIDELDAIGSRKSLMGHSSHHATVSQLLTCLDGMNDRGNVFVIGATNNLDLIDPALRRSGRFDIVIEMPLPNKESRKQIFLHYVKNSPGLEELESDPGFIEIIGERTEGFSCADMENMANEAVMIAIRETIDVLKTKRVDIEHYEYTLTMNHVTSSYQLISSKVKLEKKTNKLNF